jgi:hypothetical protein
LSQPPPPPIKGRVVAVGGCASGKSVLVAALVALRYDARACSQEHSHVPDMWQRLSRPEFLVFLDASLRAVRQRRAVDYGSGYMREQDRRLAHARAHCDLLVNTDALTEKQVLRRVLAALDVRGIHPLP